MSLSIRPILPRFGAEISGVDITRPLDEATRRAVVEAQNRWGVTVWRQTGLDDETHIAFSRIFGHLERAPERPGMKHRELFSAGNLTADGKINTDPAAITYRAGDRLWHTDSSFMDLRSAYSLLLAHEVPREGGATWFADTRSAYDDLPQETKDRLDGLEVEHSLWWSRKQGGAAITREQIDERQKARHPLVHVHAGSGRKALYLGAHAYQVVGMDWEESRALIDQLNTWTTQPAYTFSILYQPGDMVIWDNLCTYHRGGEFDYLNERRDMRRTTAREAPAPTEADDPFTRLFKEMPPLVPGQPQR
ncbi:TauD/TfdA family dioxygenase [Aquabacterium sp. J223]|uniref:TauD/TfdA dioxygenase family protein n=1 Tax=Aquabacterium sp. J223 TaxID=2898431 RepID=UPI0021AE0930|nr:TauD/TfdA family dioxygenase [Aquabacterium sp. J223]UUX95184.1 TauD/TfdA family dioxygenase [Aquabacterium sp. J223]